MTKKSSEYCLDCGGLIEIRNPTGKCDHLYYPENKLPKQQYPEHEKLKVVQESVKMKMNKQVVAIINLSKDGVSYLVHCSQCHHLIQAAPTDAPNSLIYECEQCGYYNIADKDRIPKDRQRRINYLAREP